MTIIFHKTKDMFQCENIADYMVNPTNMYGDMDKGIGLEFTNRIPELKQLYMKAVMDKKISIGKLQILNYSQYKIINLPTKIDFLAPTNLSDLKKALCALRTYFKDKPQCNVIMPLLGQSYNTEYEIGVPLFREYLDDLLSIFHVCVHPDRSIINEKYLCIFVDNSSIKTEASKVILSDIIDNSLLKWNMSLTDFDKIIIPSKNTPIGKYIESFLPTGLTNLLELELSSIKKFPVFDIMYTLFYIGNYFIILDEKDKTIPIIIHKLYRLIHLHNEQCVSKSESIKYISNDYYIDKLLNVENESISDEPPMF